MAKTPEQLLIDVEHHQQLADYHSAEMRKALKEYLLLQDETPSHLPYSRQAWSERKKIKAIVHWTNWLATNPPAFRKDIEEATGVRLTDRATPHILQWHRNVPAHNNVAHPPDKLCSIQERAQGKGRPRLIYFRWNQRFDVHPLFGVGPERPSEQDGETETLLGVIQPEPTDLGAQYAERMFAQVTLSDADQAMLAEMAKLDAVESAALPLTPKQWVDSHAMLFAQIKEGIKPTDEQKQKLRETAPDGVDVNAAIALAAVGRLDELTS